MQEGLISNNMGLHLVLASCLLMWCEERKKNNCISGRQLWVILSALNIPAALVTACYITAVFAGEKVSPSKPME